MATCVARAGGRTGDACWSRCCLAENVCWKKWFGIALVNCARTVMNSCAPSTNCWKSVHRQIKRRVQGSEKSVDNDEIAANLESTKASRWWTPSQHWAALVKQREEQVFLLVT